MFENYQQISKGTKDIILLIDIYPYQKLYKIYTLWVVWK